MSVVLTVVIVIAALGVTLGIFLLWVRWGTDRPVEHDGSGSHWSPYS